MSPEGDTVSKVMDAIGLDYNIEDEILNGTRVVTSRITRGFETVYMVIPSYTTRLVAMFVAESEEASSMQILKDLKSGAFLYVGTPEIVGYKVYKSWRIPSFETFEEFSLKYGINDGEGNVRGS